MQATHIYVIPDQGNMKGGDIYDKFGNLTYFADVTGLDDKTQDGSDVQVQVQAHTRAAFMGDKENRDVKSHTRYVSVGIRRSKGGYPGVPITLSDGTETRSFSYTGTMSGLVAWLKTTAKVEISLFGPTGTPYDAIPAASNG